MKAEIPNTTIIDITHVRLELPITYGDEDIPYDFPLRKGAKWTVLVEIDTGRIEYWPVGASGKLEIKVCDGGYYTLFGPNGEELASIEGNYVPHGLVPGRYGDYVELDINSDGVITNWPKKPDVSEFYSGND